MLIFFKYVIKIFFFVILLYVIINYNAVVKTYNIIRTVLSTPFLSPFHTEVYNAANRYLRGDKTENPLLEIIHGNLSAKLSSNLFDSSKWEIISTSSGRIAVYKEFVTIENKNSTPGTKIKYSNNQLILYLDQYSKSRALYSSVYKKTISSLNKKDKELVENMFTSLFSRNKTTSEKPLIIAIPLDENLQERIQLGVAMHESGILFASQNKSHDFISKINEYKRAYPLLSESEVIVRIASHEGSHGDIEAIIAYLLRLTMVNPIYEGIPSALSQPDACYGINTKDILTELSNMSSALKKYSRPDIAYNKGGCFWRKLYSEVKLRNPNDMDIWEKVFSVGLQTAIESNRDANFFSTNEDERISVYFKRLIQKIRTM